MEEQQTEMEQMSLNALDLLVQGCEVAQRSGLLSLSDANKIFAAIKFFKPDYESDEEQE